MIEIGVPLDCRVLARESKGSLVAMLSRLSVLMFAVVTILILTCSKSEAQFPRSTGLKTPADRAVGDLAWPNVSQWQVLARGSHSHPLISSVESKIVHHLTLQKFEGSNCDASEQSLSDFFPQTVSPESSVVLSGYANAEKTDYLFSTSSSENAHPHYESTLVRMNPAQTVIQGFITARCDGTKTMGLQYDCKITSYCKAH